MAALLVAALLFLAASANDALAEDTTHAHPSTATAPKFPWFDPSIPVEKRAALLTAAMNTTEKISQMVKWAPAIPRLGVPPFSFHTEAAHGVVSPNASTVFPVSLARAASWNVELEQAVGLATGVEGRAIMNSYYKREGHAPPYNLDGVSLTFYAPNINLVRDPRWGRAQETRGEDPLLTSKLGVAFVKGVQYQQDGTPYLLATAMLKHFFVYNLESNTPVGGSDKQYRLMYNANVSEVDMVQTFLPVFETVIADADPRTVMCSYNAVNGIPMCASPLLQQVLRDRLGFNHVIFSDGGAVTYISRCKAAPGLPPWHGNPCHNYTDDCAEASAVALNASVDLNSGGFMNRQNPKTGFAYEWLPEALQRGLVDERLLGVSTQRIFKLRMELGLFDPPETVPYWQINASSINSPEHQELAYKSAVQGMVLLRNDKHLIPLNPGSWTSRGVAVIGPNADRKETLLGNYAGCYTGSGRTKTLNPQCNLITPLQGLRSYLGPKGTPVTFAQGCEIAGNNETGFEEAVKIARDASIAIMVMGLIGDSDVTSPRGQQQEGEAFDRVNITLPLVQIKLIQKVMAVQPNTVVVLMSGGPVSEPWLAANATALVQAFYPGERAGDALARLLFGAEGFSGRLPVTFVHRKEQLAPYLTQEMNAKPFGRTHRYFTGDVLYPFGFGMSTLAHFRYSNLHVEAVGSAGPCCTTEHPIFRVTVTVTNEGPGVQDEVVMVYAELTETAVDLPSKPRQLLGAFQRISFDSANASVSVTLEVGARALALVDSDLQRRVVPGTWTIHVGGRAPGSPGMYVDSSAFGCPDAPLSQTVELK